MTRLAQEAWSFCESGAGSAAWNMALDEATLEGAGEWRRPVLRFYAWSEPAATFGYFQRMDDVRLWTTLRPLVRRPTGGGLVLHDADWTYSLVMPPGHAWHRLKARESYAQMHGWIAEAFRDVGVSVELAPATHRGSAGRCFARAAEADVLWRGRKVAGAAQRRNRLGLLIQGSIQPPPEGPGRRAFERALLGVAERRWGIRWEALVPPSALLARAADLAHGKYASTAYNEAR